MIIAMPRAAGALAIAVVAVLGVAATPAAANEQPAGSAPESSAGIIGPQIIRQAGRLLVVWTNTTASGDTDIHAQRLSAKTGAKFGPEFRINAVTTKQQLQSAIAILKDSSSVVVWSSLHEGFGIYGRRVDARTGAALGPEFRIDAGTRALNRTSPAVAALNSGGFVVVWSDYTQNNTFYDIRGQIFNAAGRKRGGVFIVANSHVSEGSPDVAPLANGGFVVAWDIGGLVQIQRYAATGAKTGSIITPFAWSEGRLAGLADGGFVIVGTAGRPGTITRNAFAQRFAADGTGDEPHRAFPSGRTQYNPAVSLLPNGGYVTVWSQGARDICGRRYRSDGEPNGASFCANAVPAGATASHPSVAAITNDRFAITFELQTQSAYGITAGILDLSEEADATSRFSPLGAQKQ